MGVHPLATLEWLRILDAVVTLPSSRSMVGLFPDRGSEIKESLGRLERGLRESPEEIVPILLIPGVPDGIVRLLCDFVGRGHFRDFGDLLIARKSEWSPATKRVMMEKILSGTIR